MANGLSIGKQFTSALVVTGYMVGAGILALPINLGPSGILPAVAGALAVWFLMTCTGLVISRQPFLAENEDADLPTLFEAVLGPAGKKFSVVANLVILYGLLVAYLAGVASVAVSSFKIGLPEWAVLVIYFCVATLLASLGDTMLRKGNAVLMTLMWLLFGTLLVLVVPHFQGIDAEAADMKFFTSGLPILVVAFNFHNVVPTLCRVLNHDRKAIDRTIWIGSGIGMTMTLVWTVAVMITLPMESTNGVDIISAFKAGVPATVPLDKLIQSKAFVDASIAFAVVAMTTSYMGTGVSLMSFLKDVAGDRLRSRLALWLVTFIPPLIIGIVYPGIFLEALNIVGGMGIGTLFGILPGILLIKQSAPGSKGRLAGYAVVAFFTIVMLVEIGQETGLLHIAPNIKYWSHVHHAM
ncbi:aromatic amino acid transport family protein [Pseudodesulfovibrio sp. zrk46]|uniref:aromatic amino acid transport family protein n=1 Tax=Pseudodesulfovibrio sp. zrk46 TaxID=2725288 RepID=UPI0014496437|nr:aromatic amino acid transport family protein [Pseudodesulfovibrio sp. zrk46]QJB55058.1 tryptophan/tyrosine permease [Pseudodesulfovibrio sp. zrk46]